MAVPGQKIDLPRLVDAFIFQRDLVFQDAPDLRVPPAGFTVVEQLHGGDLLDAGRVRIIVPQMAGIIGAVPAEGGKPRGIRRQMLDEIFGDDLGIGDLGIRTDAQVLDQLPGVKQGRRLHGGIALGKNGLFIILFGHGAVPPIIFSI